jgi:hypothetical protein
MLKRQRQSKLPPKLTASKSIHDSEYFWRICCNCKKVIPGLEASNCWTGNCNHDSCSKCGRVEKKAPEEVPGACTFGHRSRNLVLCCGWATSRHSRWRSGTRLCARRECRQYWTANMQMHKRMTLRNFVDMTIQHPIETPIPLQHNQPTAYPVDNQEYSPT